jgi:type I restriction enzyme S subunit
MSSKAKTIARKEEATPALVPKLRFPEFREVDGWAQKEVGELFQVTRGDVLSMTLVRDEKTDSTPYPVYSSQTKNDGLSGYYSEYLFEDAITWTTDGANAGDVNFRTGKFFCTNVCGVLLTSKGFANPCIAALINRVSAKYVSYVGNPKLMNGVMRKIPIPVPSLPEQQKIAECLSSVDALMTAQARKVAALKTHKKGLMQQLFPREGETQPRLRFSEFHTAGEWELVNVSQFAKVTTGAKDTQNKVEGGKYPFFVRSQTVERIDSYSHDGEAVLTSGDGVGVGKNFHYINGKFDFHQRVYCIYDFAYEVSGLFFYLYFSEHFGERVMRMSAKNSVDSVRMAMITEMPVLLPTLAEQLRIASCLSSLDAQITAEIQKHEALKTHKKGLMQQLFPSPEAVEV